MLSAKSLNPRKVPQQARSRKMVSQILEAATRVLEEDGLKGFNTNAVAEAAGISIGSLYQYFPDKDSMVAMLIHRRVKAFLLALQNVTATLDQSFEQQIRGLVEVAVEQQLTSAHLARLLDLEEMRLPLDAETQAAQSEIIGVVSQLLERKGYRDIAIVAQDVVAIARGMIDTAGAVGECDASSLEKRVAFAIFGYLYNQSGAFANARIE